MHIVDGYYEIDTIMQSSSKYYTIQSMLNTQNSFNQNTVISTLNFNR